MAAQIQALFIDPPIAIARLGGSDVPVDSYHWVDSPDPHLQTTVAPTWTLDVQVDATIVPRMPQRLILRDGDLIRPVAPFFEVWGLVGEEGSPPGSWTQQPLTPALLDNHGATLADLTISIDARNAKAARRTRNPELRFGTFPPLQLTGDSHARMAILGVSPPRVQRPMIPRGRHIPLGFVHILRSMTQPSERATAWAREVNVEVIRFRFWPAKGLFYGPPSAAALARSGFPPIKLDTAFLDGRAGWVDAAMTDWMDPADTFDGEESRGRHSIGVVDDTCSATVEAALALGGRNRRVLSTRAEVFVAPPHFAPDHRPFLSLADEVNDRTTTTREPLSVAEREAWIRDLFERAYETLSLLNVDFYRSDRASQLARSALRPQPIPGDRTPAPTRAMGGRDALRAADIAIAAPSPDQPLPLTERARERHRNLAELDELKTLVRQNPQRLLELIRPPFAVVANEDGTTSTMQMPPFMRNSNGNPLTIAAWQYALLLDWAGAVGVTELSTRAAQRRTEVLRRRASAR